MAKPKEDPFYLPLVPFNQNSVAQSAVINSDEGTDKFNSSTYCRTCANVDSCLVPIFKGEGLDHELNKKIEKYLPIQISQEDDLPVQLCYHCASTLIAWDTLILGCLEAEKKLKNLKNSLGNKEIVEAKADDEISTGDCNISDNVDSDDEPLITKKYVSRKGAKRKTGKKREILQEKTDEQKETKTDTHESKRLTEIQPFSTYQRHFGVRNSFIVELLKLKDDDNNTSCCKVRDAIDNLNDNNPVSEPIPKTPKPKTPVTCQNCGKKLSSQISLNNHMKIHTSEKTLTCHICGKTFKHRFNLIRHLRVIHEGLRKHECADCGKKYRSQGELEDHKNIHDNKQKIICETCGRTFLTKASFYPHRKSHKTRKSSVGRFSCDECNKTFTTKKSKNQHMLIHTGEKPLVCTICDKRFRTRANYSQHIKVHSNVKHFSCEHCGKRFGRKDHLTIHVRCHTGEKPFVCNDCGRGFAQMSDMKKHKKIHEKV